MTTESTQDFRMNRRGSASVAVLSLVLLGFAVFAARFSHRFGASRYEILWLLLSVLVFGGLAALGIACWRRPPVVLRVGPEGITMPIVWRGPVSWADMLRVTRIRHRQAVGSVELLRIDLVPGVLPPYRIRTVAAWERAFLKRTGLRLPLDRLDAPADAIVASIARFRPVQTLPVSPFPAP